MEATKVCPNGHRYRADLDECPFCPKTDPSAKTVLDKPVKHTPDKSKGPQADKPTGQRKTVLDAPVEKTARPGGSGGARKTVILEPEPAGASEEQRGAAKAGVQGKLIGWLVSFDWNPNGQDYRLHVGKTRIGSGNDVEIQLPDGMVSGFHAELLYRGGVLKLRDNFSTNGTFVNGEDVGDVPRVLQDGDNILIGRTHLKLRLIDTVEAS